MKLLVVGNGGREHALAWKLANSPRVDKVYVAPGNGGTAQSFKLENIVIPELAKGYSTLGIHALADFVEKEKIYFTVVGPEAPLAAGIVDIFRSRGLKIFGPTQSAAQLESSKKFAKDFLKRHNIPTANYADFNNAQAARQYLLDKPFPIVIKADGLASGKGVFIAENIEQANEAIDNLFTLNNPSTTIVIEEFLKGEEASFIVMVDGENVLPLATSQDHKRLLDGDLGPNTGGMGAYSPAPLITPQMHAKIMREIILPTIRGLQAEGIRYTGFLYAGLMVCDDGVPYTLEFNCRLGDPEAQTIMMRIKSDLSRLIELAIDGELGDEAITIDWDRRTALGVVLAARGYPYQPESGAAIYLPAEDKSQIHFNALSSMIFHGSTGLQDQTLVTSGGRVLCAVALADSIRAAQNNAYQLVKKIEFDGMQYRRDIGHHAISEQTPKAI